MKKQLLLVSAILGLTTASFASEREGGMGSGRVTMSSNSILGIDEANEATRNLNQEELLNCEVMNNVAAKFSLDTNEKKLGFAMGYTSFEKNKAQLSTEMVQSFEAEKVKAGNALIKMFADSMNARKVSAIKQLNSYLSSYTTEDAVGENTDLQNVEINDLVDAKIASVLESVTSNIDASIVNDFKAPIQNSLNAIKAELSAVKAFNTNSIRDIFASYDAASRDIVARDMAAKESEFESRVNFEVERRSNVGMNRSELRERETEDFGLEEKSTKFTSRKIEEPKIEEPIEKKPTQSAKKEEKKAYNPAEIADYKSVPAGMKTAAHLKSKGEEFKNRYNAWVANGKPQS